MKLEFLSPAKIATEIDSLDDLRAHFARHEWKAPSLMPNFVADRHGNLVGATGSSRDISNPLDRSVLLGLRDACDVILTTSITARAEGYKRSRLAPLAILSRSGDFAGIPAVTHESAGPQNSLVYLLVPRKLIKQTRRTFTSPWIKVASIGKASWFNIAHRLSRLNFRRVLLETGVSATRDAVAAFACKELSLTVVNPEAESPLVSCKKALANLGVAGASLEWAERVENTLFTRWSNLTPPENP